MQIAQINIAHSKAEKDDPIMADFYANIDRINALGKKSTGFVWLYDMDIDPLQESLFGGDAFVVNYSVWESVDALFDFTYKTAHAEIFRRRKEWFHKVDGFHMAIWYVKDGHQPSQQEAAEKLNQQLFKQHRINGYIRKASV